MYVFQQKSFRSRVTVAFVWELSILYVSITMLFTQKLAGHHPPSPQSPYYQDRVHKLSSLRCVSYHVICIRVIVVWFNNSSHPYPHRQSYQDWVNNLSCLRCVIYHVICMEVTVVCFNDSPHPYPHRQSYQD